jgi:hypothetical protein
MPLQLFASNAMISRCRFGASLTIEEGQPPVLVITLRAQQTDRTIEKSETENVRALDHPEAHSVESLPPSPKVVFSRPIISILIAA